MGLFGNNNKTNTVTTTATLTPQQNKVLKAANPYIKRYKNKTSPAGVQLPDTPMVAPQNANQIAGQNQALAAVPEINAIGGRASATHADLMDTPENAGFQYIKDWKNPASNATDFLLDRVLYPESNPALQGAIDAAVRPISQNLTESQLPAVRSGAYTTGNFGSSRQGIAEGLASGRASQAIGDTAANVANQNYQAGLGAMSSAYGNLLGASTSAYGTKTGALADLYSNNLNARLNALGMTPQVQGAQLTGALTTSGVGDVQQAADQRARDEATYRALYGQMAPLQSAQNLIALSGAIPGGSTTTTGPAQQQSPFSGALGGASLGAALLPGLGPLGVLSGAALGGGLSLV
jgi:hypothetical protein